MTNFNISSFFSNPKSSGLSAINFSDYASIKNGSYKKLVKSYYAKQKDTVSTDKPNKTPSKTKRDDVDTTGLSKMKAEATELKKSADSLSKADLWKQTDGKYDMDKISKAIKGFASEYNDVVEQSEKVTSKDVTQQTGFMTSMSKTMSKALEKVGVTIGEDGKMSVDEDKLKKADGNDLKRMFSGSFSYAAQVGDKAGAISSAAVRSASMYSSNGTMSNTMTGMFNEWI